MSRIFILFIMMVFTANIVNATKPSKADDTAAVQEQLRREYGSCYDDFALNLASCKRSTCTYPDLTTAKSWKTQVINGMSNKECYVMYYSFMGEEITSDPDHCFYDKDTVATLVHYYKRLFHSDSDVEIMNLKGKINYLSLDNCKKNEDKKDQNY